MRRREPRRRREGLEALVFSGAATRTGAARRRGAVWVGVLVAGASRC